MQKLTVSEKARLTELEKIIEEGLPTFQRVGWALLRIRDERLYRLEYENFPDYCRARWDMGKSRAYQLIAACQIGQDSSTNGGRPENERQARALISADRIAELKRKALAGLSPEDRRELIEDEEEALVHRSMPHTHGGQGRKVRMLQIERIARRFRFLVEGLGDEVEVILVKFDRVMEQIRGLPE